MVLVTVLGCVVAVPVGLCAGLSGGVLVAVLNGDVPALLVPGRPYGLLALAGILVYLVLAPVSGALAGIACLLVVVSSRVATRHWDVRTPPVPPLPAGSGHV